ncbi:hypothetical protein BLNAU_16589 [Blattamonas nauphoetae]|uniref:Uncharacterized protein n=1 Tax=Blattamonas nauphoetae TaxID=2049346 RepID=A0ABQ9XE58_9EUKA|nr:hypothetical protein BLNAU_16589 [Blattamonas nauphoetae]
MGTKRKYFGRASRVHTTSDATKHCRLGEVVALFRSGIALFIRADLNTGTTTACPTFASPPLTAHTLSNCLLSRQKEQERETEQQLKLE